MTTITTFSFSYTVIVQVSISEFDRRGFRDACAASAGVSSLYVSITNVQSVSFSSFGGRHLMQGDATQVTAQIAFPQGQQSQADAFQQKLNSDPSSVVGKHAVARDVQRHARLAQVVQVHVVVRGADREMVTRRRPVLRARGAEGRVGAEHRAGLSARRTRHDALSPRPRLDATHVGAQVDGEDAAAVARAEHFDAPVIAARRQQRRLRGAKIDAPHALLVLEQRKRGQLCQLAQLGAAARRAAAPPRTAARTAAWRCRRR